MNSIWEQKCLKEDKFRQLTLFLRPMKPFCAETLKDWGVSGARGQESEDAPRAGIEFWLLFLLV